MAFWETKIARNRHRDEVTMAHLGALGWHVVTIWECELRGASSVALRLDELAEEITEAGVMRQNFQNQRQRSRLEFKRERKDKLNRQVMLEKEIASKFKIPRKVREDAVQE